MHQLRQSLNTEGQDTSRCYCPLMRLGYVCTSTQNVTYIQRKSLRLSSAFAYHEVFAGGDTAHQVRCCWLRYVEPSNDRGCDASLAIRTWIFLSRSTFSTISGSILASFLVHFRCRIALTALRMTDAECMRASMSVTSWYP